MAPASETSSLHQRDEVDVAIAGDDLRLIGTLTCPHKVTDRGLIEAHRPQLIQIDQELDRKLVTGKIAWNKIRL